MTIRIAVIGAGLIGRRHIDLVNANPKCKLTAICDPTPAVAQLANQHNVPYFQRYQALIEQIEVDGPLLPLPILCMFLLALLTLNEASIYLTRHRSTY